MLRLKGIEKFYKTGDGGVLALKGIDINFKSSEFVSVLGPSGCGKTTLLNIIGGLDHYTAGEMSIDGVSTKEYGDRRIPCINIMREQALKAFRDWDEKTDKIKY